MKTLVREWTADDLKTYMNRRACDGNWGFDIATACIDFYHRMPNKKWYESKRKYKERADQFYREHCDELWNLQDYPNIAIDIETGEIQIKEKTDAINN